MMGPLVRSEIGESDMRESSLSTEAGRQYASAYDAHCTTKDIHKVFTLYMDGHL